MDFMLDSQKHCKTMWFLLGFEELQEAAGHFEPRSTLVRPSGPRPRGGVGEGKIEDLGSLDLGLRISKRFLHALRPEASVDCFGCNTLKSY